jgi:flagellum-specific peptidoglycan hydrolase FlgJ
MNQTESSFLANAVPAALATEKQYDVPASITLAQAILESGWGQTALAKQANNFFGIKAIHFTDPESYIEFPTKEFVDGRAVTELAKFARYPSPAESFAAHAQLLSLAERYKPAMAVAHDPEAFAMQLQECGYSTNPGYAVALMQLVTEFDLTQYDAQPEPPPAAQPTEA